ncbi:hypothetical protein MHYP_G00154490 [Metynnis hypsauchen]
MDLCIYYDSEYDSVTEAGSRAREQRISSASSLIIQESIFKRYSLSFSLSFYPQTMQNPLNFHSGHKCVSDMKV